MVEKKDGFDIIILKTTTLFKKRNHTLDGNHPISNQSGKKIFIHVLDLSSHKSRTTTRLIFVPQTFNE